MIIGRGVNGRCRTSATDSAVDQGLVSASHGSRGSAPPARGHDSSPRRGRRVRSSNPPSSAQFRRTGSTGRSPGTREAQEERAQPRRSFSFPWQSALRPPKIVPLPRPASATRLGVARRAKRQARSAGGSVGLGVTSLVLVGFVRLVGRLPARTPAGRVGVRSLGPPDRARGRGRNH